MKKCDLHIHTIPTIKDVAFTFDMDVLVDYVKTNALDVIAITNHNSFDKSQFEQIKDILSYITVLPGIEVDLDGGHVIIITDNDADSILDFSNKCNAIKLSITDVCSFISFEQLQSIFGDFSKYLIIPHSDKEPNLPKSTIAKFTNHITCGEVGSVKKFLYALKNDNALVPVYFSDARVAPTLRDNLFSMRQTYLDLNTVDVRNLKLCLRDKAKVALSSEGGHLIFPCLPNGLQISTGLNVVLGKRSSGKTHFLSEVDKYIGGEALYIRQFELLKDQSADAITQFAAEDRQLQERIALEYLTPFRMVLDDIINVRTKQADVLLLENYVSALLKYANEENLTDVFSKTKMYNENTYGFYDQKSIKQLVDATLCLLDTAERDTRIFKYVAQDGLKTLLAEFVNEYSTQCLYNSLIVRVNTTIDNIKKDLQMRSTATRVPDINFADLVMNFARRKKFNQVVDALKKPRCIGSREIGDFTVETSTSPYANATDMAQGIKVSLVDLFERYNNGFDFLQELKNIGTIQSSTYYNYFTKVSYRILNKYKQPVSGGERTEFNFLQRIKDAMMYDALIIDEPESSFDNVFLKTQVNQIIKEIAQIIPVIIATHNSTIGASINPDYIIFTEKQIVNNTPAFKIYGGYPTDHFLKTTDGGEVKNFDVVMDSLEAGECAYNERKDKYEILKN